MTSDPPPESLGQRIRTAGDRLNSTAEEGFKTALAVELRDLIGPPFQIATGIVVSPAGEKSAPFSALICKQAGPTIDADKGGSVSVNSVAAVFDVTEVLDVEGLAAAYHRIRLLKEMRTSHSAAGDHFEPTLGIIFAKDTTASFEDCANELERLNAGTPSEHWVDLIVVSTKGHISYSIQKLDETQISGLLLPASLNANQVATLPYYAMMMIGATGAITFNFAMHVTLANLARWAPGYAGAEFSSILDGVERHAITKAGYQPDLAGRLRPVPPNQYQGRSLPLRSVSLFARGSEEQLGAIAFLKWQDGAVVMLQGKLPLEGLLVFLGDAIDFEALKKVRVLKSGDMQVSSVIPLGENEYRILLRNIQKRGGLNVRQDQNKFVIQKFADEGTSTPFIARVLLAPMVLARNFGADDEAFEEAHHSLMTTLMEIRDSARDIARTWREFSRGVDDGSLIFRRGPNIHVTATIDRQLGRYVSDFLTGATRSFKERMQLAARSLGIEIGFLYQKKATFERAITAASMADPALAAYLREARLWGDVLVTTRNNLDHGTWKLPRAVIDDRDGRIVAIEPTVAGTPVSRWVEDMTDRILCFAEDILVHAIQKRLPPQITLTEIPLADRLPENPARFEATVAGSLPAWEIRYHPNKFEDR